MPRAIAALALTVLFVAGCTSRPPEPVTVRGKVLSTQKKPVTGVIVRFWPQPTLAGSTDRPTEADGSFTLSCPPGKYTATLMPIPLKQSGEPAAAPGPDSKKGPVGTGTVPARLRDVTLTPWRDIDVPAGGRDGLELVIAE